MPPLKAAAFHGLVRQELDPLMRSLGFARTPGASMASWARPEGDEWLLFWFQPSMSNYAYSAGFKFVVEFQLGPEAQPGGRGHRLRLGEVLTDAEREQVRQMENRVIAKLPPPDRGFAASLDGRTREWSLGQWQPVGKPYGPGDDIWFRHGDEADVLEFLAFFGAVLPDVVTRFLDLAREAKRKAATPQV
jgi:hypothetical protein